MHYPSHCHSRRQHALLRVCRHCRGVAVFTFVLFLPLQWAHAGPAADAPTEQPPSKPTATITQEVFQNYKDLNDFMEQSPQVTELSSPGALDVMEYGPDVLKTVTGPDCNRDGKLDDLTVCRKEFLRLWLLFNSQ